MGRVRPVPWDAWTYEDTIQSVMKALHQKPIGYYPLYADIMASAAGGIVLSQLLYWHAAVDGKKFFKTDDEIRKETRVSERELKEAKRALKRMSFIKIKVEGLPARTFYEFNTLALARYIGQHIEATSSDKVSPPVRTPCPNQFGQGVQTYNTTENTTENTADISSCASPKNDEEPRWQNVGYEELPWPSVEALVKLYNDKSPDELAAVLIISPARAARVREMLKKFPQRTFWEECMAQLHASPLMRGLKKTPGHEHWRADFDWLLGKKDGIENCVRLHDGRYHG